MSPSPMDERPAGSAADSVTDSVTDNAAGWPLLPTETEIYILPDGRVVLADLPAELLPLAAALGAVEASEIAPHIQGSDLATWAGRPRLGALDTCDAE